MSNLLSKRLSEALTSPSFVGFDRMFNALPDIAEGAYPPFNVFELSPEEYAIEIAVAGFSKDDISITTKDNVLIVTGESTEEYKEDVKCLHKGISSRKFARSFVLSNDVEHEIKATMADGILKINVVYSIPEDRKPKTIDIS